MNTKTPTIYIIDDDKEVCDALRWLFESVLLTVESYTNPRQFLANYTPQNQGCLIMDVRMPEMSGLQLLEHLNLQKNRLPVIVITGHQDIPSAIRAMKLGASDFILKPLHEQDFLEIVQKNIDNAISQSNVLEVLDKIRERINSLSPRERQVIDLLLEGKLNKEIAYEIGRAHV